MNSKLPEEYWKKMQFCVLSVIHLFEWKIGFHSRIKCEESGKSRGATPRENGMSQKDAVKLQFFWRALLSLVRVCSEKSFERTYSPGLNLAKIRRKLIKMRDEMAEDLNVLDKLRYCDKGIEYAFSMEARSGQKSGWE